MIRQYELVETVKSYDPSADEEAINRAYVFAMKHHGKQRRESGDPYFSHPVEVAGILAAMRLDTASIVTALLHDTVEDTEATLDQIRELFGAEVAQLVDGVTKLSQLDLQSTRTKQAENFRKLLLAMSKDIRVLLVKLADRLHNMSTLDAIGAPERRRRIAEETMEIYAPLAERIGMQRWRDELVNRAFRELYPEVHASISRRLDFLRNNDPKIVERIQTELTTKLAEASIHAEVTGREKGSHSIWEKMRRKDIAFEQLADIMAFRVVVDEMSDCYSALGVIHGAYRMIPGRFKDYISTPKLNGYRSIHTGVIGPERQRIEIQIRTRAMHELAEFGVAAHWRYKQGGQGGDGNYYQWIRSLLDILEQAAGPEEFLENTKLEMFQDQVFCFTPKGDLIALPTGATPVDFAYSVHSEIGDRCVGAKINGRLVPLRSRLTNGDQVEIMTSAKSKGPSPEWERFVVTGKARARIRRNIRLQQRDQYVALGREVVRRVFAEAGAEATDRALEPALKQFGVKTAEDLLAAIGAGLHTERDLRSCLFPESRAEDGRSTPKVVPLDRARRDRNKAAPPVPITGLIPGMALHFARCCHPLPGDPIVGIVTTGKGITIHTHDCFTLETFGHAPERWIDVDWDKDTPGSHTARIRLIVSNEPGNLGNLSTVIAQNRGNISNLRFTNRAVDFFEMQIDIEVADVAHLSNIIAALRAQPSISSVERARA